MGEVSVNDLEGGTAVGGVDSRVDYEFGHGEMLVPIVLSSASVKAEVLLDFLVCSFGLSVSLWVIRRGQVGINAESSKEGAGELGCKLGAAVGGDTEGESMEAEDLAVEEVGHAFRVDVRCAGEGVNHLAEVVGEDCNGVKPVGLG